MLKIEDITIEKLESGNLEKDLPEFYDLKNVNEKNAWHDETTFEHVLMFLEEYEKFLQNLRQVEIIEYLNEKILTHAKKDLLKIVILLHDIAKKETYTENEDLTTAFPDHAKVGAEKASTILNGFLLSDEEKKYVIKNIAGHNDPHVILGDKENCQKLFINLRKEYSDIFKELIILGMLDTISSRLKDTDQNEFNYRIGVYRNLLGIE